MRRSWPWPILLACLAVAVCGSAPARAELIDRAAADPAGLCAAAIGSAERAHGTPPGLLQAIARVESGRRDPLTGRLEPWPYTIDVDGQGHFYDTEAQAIAAIREARAQGHVSIDVGCLQVNLQQHPDAFGSLAAALEPGSNADYAARFLRSLHDAAGDWMIAAGQYHSLTPALAAPYRARVMAMLQRSEGDGLLGETARPAFAMAPPAALSPFGGGRFLMQGATRPPPMAVAAGRALAAYRAAPIAIARTLFIRHAG